MERTVNVMPDAPVKNKGGRPRKNFTDKNAKGERQNDERKRPASLHDGRDQSLQSAQDVHKEHDEPWVRPSSLPEIPARSGYVQRWIRVATGGKADASNISRRYREGWRPRRMETVPKNIGVPTLNTGEYAGCVGVEGSVLMEMPVERNTKRNTYYADQRSRQTQSIDQTLAKEAEHNSRAFGQVRKAERSTQVREVAVAADE